MFFFLFLKFFFVLLIIRKIVSSPVSTVCLQKICLRFIPSPWTRDSQSRQRKMYFLILDSVLLIVLLLLLEAWLEIGVSKFNFW